MGNQLFVNNFSSTVPAGLGAGTGTTSLVLATGDGAKLGTIPAGDFIKLTLTQASGAETSWEIVHATAVTGDTLTVARAQEGTTAAAWPAGTKIEARFTAASVAPSSGNITAGTSLQATPAGDGSSQVTLAQAPRGTATYTTPSLSPNQVDSSGYLDLGALADLTKLVATHPCWVRIYGSAAARSADASRLITNDPAPASGIYLDAAPGYSGYALSLDLSPIATFIALEGANPLRAYLSIQNLDVNTETIGVTVTYKVDEG